MVMDREKGKPGDKQKWRDALNSYLTNNKKEFDRPQKFYWSFAMGDEDDGMGPALQPCRLLKGKPLPAPKSSVPIEKRMWEEERGAVERAEGRRDGA